MFTKKHWWWIACVCILQGSVVHTKEAKECQSYMDLLLVLDTSTSISENAPAGDKHYYFNLMTRFANDVLDELLRKVRDQAQIGILEYSSEPYVVSHFEEYKDASSLREDLDKLRYRGGNTNTYKALEKAQDMFMRFDVRPNARKVLLLITDGLSNVEWTREVVDRLKQNGVEMYTVGLTPYIDEIELQVIASSPPQKFFFWLPIHDVLDQVVQQTVDGLCFPPTSICTLDLISDLVLILDSSGSIRDNNPKLDNGTVIMDNYDELKRFVVSLIDLLDVGPDLTRIAAIRFSTLINVEFYLNDHLYSKEAMKQDIWDMEYYGSETNISGAIRTARQQVFKYGRGDRPNVRNIILIITDGYSNVDEHLTIPEANLAKQENITIFAIGVTNLIREVEIKAIASVPVTAHYFNTPDFQYLPTLKERLLQQVCKHSPTGFPPLTNDPDYGDKGGKGDSSRVTRDATFLKLLLLLVISYNHYF